MSRHKSNARFANPCGMGPQSSFEQVVRALGLSPEQYADSDELRAWVQRNKNFRYVPPDVLIAFGFKPGAEV